MDAGGTRGHADRGRDPVEDFYIIERELRLHDAALAQKPHIVAANKIDALDDPDRLTRLEAHVRALGYECFRLSGVTGDGVPELLEAMWRQIAAVRAVPPPPPEPVDAGEERDLITPARLRRDA